jgi:Tfp pilus assembly protein PilV
MRRRQRGATLVEILLSLAVVLVGMLALFRVLASSISASALGSRMSQAQVRAVAIVDAIRHAPVDSSNPSQPVPAVLNCLAGTPIQQWSALCESLCNTLQTGATKTLDGCIYTVDSFNLVRAPDLTGALPNSATGQTFDRNRQQYALDPTTKVTASGTGTVQFFDVDIVIGWNDDGTATITNDRSYHKFELRTGVLSP